MPSQARAPASRSAPTPRRICILINPHAGVGAGESLGAQVSAALEAEGADATLRRADGPGGVGAAAARAAAEGFDVVAAAGGDGTLNAAANGLGAGSRAALGLIPTGTFNFVARSLGVPVEPVAAARLLARGAIRPMDAGAVNGRLFLNNASLGAYPRILRRRETLYDRLGRSRMAAHYSVIDALARSSGRMRLTLTTEADVRRLATPLIFVALNPDQLERFGLEGAASVRDGRFAILVAPPGGRLALLRAAARLGARRARGGRDYRLIAARDAVIDPGEGERDVACDGERARMRGPFRFERRAGALRMIAP